MRLVRAGKSSQLIGAGFALVSGLPFGKRLAIDDFPRLLLAERLTTLFGRFAIPVGKAISAKTGLRHQIDVLYITARGQVLQQATKCSGFKFGADVGHRYFHSMAYCPGRKILAPAFERFRVDVDNARIRLES